MIFVKLFIFLQCVGLAPFFFCRAAHAGRATCGQFGRRSCRTGLRWWFQVPIKGRSLRRGTTTEPEQHNLDDPDMGAQRESENVPGTHVSACFRDALSVDAQPPALNERRCNRTALRKACAPEPAVDALTRPSGRVFHRPWDQLPPARSLSTASAAKGESGSGSRSRNLRGSRCPPSGRGPLAGRSP